MSTQADRIYNAQQFFSTVQFLGDVVLPDDCVGNDQVATGAGIAASKLEHQYEKNVTQPNTAATDETRVIHVVRGATATVQEFRAGSIAKAAGGATCTVDLKKNGSSILSSPITLDSGNSDYVPESAAVTSPDLVADDVLTVVIDGTVGGGTLPTGVYADLVLREDAN